MVEKKEKRFRVKSEEGFGFGVIQIVVDKVTGVNYIPVFDSFLKQKVSQAL